MNDDKEQETTPTFGGLGVYAPDDEEEPED